MISAQKPSIHRLTQSVRWPIFVLVLFYGLFTGLALLQHDGNPDWFVWIGTRFQDGDPQGNIGYDGQFVYYIAQDGWDSAENLDIPAYRLQRILYPLLVRLVSLNNPAATAWAMLLVNFAVIVATTAVLARWLRKQSISPWLSLAYGLYIGTFLAYSRNVNEPLAFGLAAIGVVLWLDQRLWPAVFAFALAALAKESTLLLPFGLGVATLLTREWRKSILLLVAVIPFLIWQWMLWQRFGVFAVGLGSSIQFVPLWGIVSQLSAEFGRLSSLLFVALPALLLALFALLLLWQRKTPAIAGMLLINAIFVLLLPTDVYDHVMHAGRNATGLVIATIFAFPLMQTWWRRLLSAWWIAPTMVWFIPVLRWAPWLQ